MPNAVLSIAYYMNNAYIVYKGEMSMKHSSVQTVDMQKYPAADLARNTGELLRAASVAPVTITKHKKDCFVVMSTERYEALTKNTSTQRAFAVADMPDDLGKLLDQGLEELLNDE